MLLLAVLGTVRVGVFPLADEDGLSDRCISQVNLTTVVTGFILHFTLLSEFSENVVVVRFVAHASPSVGLAL